MAFPQFRFSVDIIVPLYRRVALARVPFNTAAHRLYEPLTSEQVDNITFTTMLVRHRVLLKWEWAQPPSISTLLTEVMIVPMLDKVRYSLKGSIDYIWHPFISFFGAFHQIKGRDLDSLITSIPNSASSLLFPPFSLLSTFPYF